MSTKLIPLSNEISTKRGGLDSPFHQILHSLRCIAQNSALKFQLAQIEKLTPIFVQKHAYMCGSLFIAPMNC